MKSILAWPKTVWLAGSRINHFLIAKFDDNRAVYCFVWFPITQIGLLLLIVPGVLLPSLVGAVAWVFFAPIYIVFGLPVYGLYFLSLLLLMQAYFGLFAAWNWPLFSGFERILADFVALFRDGTGPRTQPTEQQ